VHYRAAEWQGFSYSVWGSFASARLGFSNRAFQFRFFLRRAISSATRESSARNLGDEFFQSVKSVLTRAYRRANNVKVSSALRVGGTQLRAARDVIPPVNSLNSHGLRDRQKYVNAGNEEDAITGT